MSATDKFLKPHNVFGELTFDQYCSRIPEFYFKMEVPEDVIKNFQVVEKMMALSFYEYRLIDEAYAKAIYTFEMAMRIRYRDFFEDHQKKHGFYYLAKKLSELNLFEINEDVLEYIRDKRNFYAHPERHSFGGMIFWNRIEFLTRLINEMYEDRSLRSERIDLSKQLSEKLISSNLDKAIVMQIKGVRTLLHKLQLLFVNNKLNPHTYLFACTPLFDLTIEEGSVKVPMMFEVKLVSPSLNDCTLEGISVSAKEKVMFNPIKMYPELLAEFEKWNEEYSKIDVQKRFIGTEDFNLSHLIIPELREFQQM